MDTTNAVRHWNNWFPKDRESFELTAAEEQFIAASIGTERRNWVGTPTSDEWKPSWPMNRTCSTASGAFCFTGSC